jgi:hypothetical protein
MNFIDMYYFEIFAYFIPPLNLNVLLRTLSSNFGYIYFGLTVGDQLSPAQNELLNLL